MAYQTGTVCINLEGACSSGEFGGLNSWPPVPTELLAKYAGNK